MSLSKPKHHHIPQWHIKNFNCESKTTVAYFNTDRGRIELRNASSIFNVRGQYIVDIGRNSGDALETEYYKKIDNDACAVFSKWMPILNKGILPSFSDADEIVAKKYLFSLWSRSPSHRNFDEESKILKSRVRNFLGYQEGFDEEHIEAIFRNAVVGAQFPEKVETMISYKETMARRLQFVITHKPDHMFLLGDAIAYGGELLPPRLKGRQDSFWFALTPRVAVSPLGLRRARKVHRAPGNSVMAHNKNVASSSSELAASSPEVLYPHINTGSLVSKAQRSP